MGAPNFSRIVSHAEKPLRPFVVLVSSDSDLTNRSFASVLTQNGYSVLQSRNADETFALACGMNPDAVILDGHSPVAVGTCQRLLASPRFSAATPVILTTADGNARNDRLAAYTAGAWDICSHPVDGNILLVKLQTFIKAKLLADRARDASLLDAATGLYNADGLSRRGSEIGADALRRRLPVACVTFAVLSDDPASNFATQSDVLAHIASTCARVGRASDAIGRFDGRLFAIIAPATDTIGAQRLLRRYHSALVESWVSLSDCDAGLAYVGGICASDDFSESAMSVSEMLSAAADRMTLLF